MAKFKFPLTQRKLRKLRRDPRQFLFDAIRNRASSVNHLASTAIPLLPRGLIRTENRYTVIAAVFNVERYLPDFFSSMARQTMSMEDHIELIMVDDGSDDGSADVIEKWQQRYPKTIRYIYKENGGQASARNVGLAHATGNWVTFIDPDDFVHPRYFESVDRFIFEHDDKKLTLLSSRCVFYHEDGKRYADNHPLDICFRDGSYAKQCSPQSDLMLFSATRSFFRADILAREGLYFDETLRPNFEDGMFSGQYVLKVREPYIGYVADAIYYYRKRGDGTSTLDTGWEKPGRFGVVVEDGYLRLLREAKQRHGVVPRSIQNMVLYDLIWIFKRVIDNESSISFLDSAQKERFRSLLFEVFKSIDASTIMRFSLAGAWFFHKVGFLGLFKGEAPPYQIVYVEDYDETKDLALLNYFYSGDPLAERFMVNKEDVVPSYAKVRVHGFLSDAFAYERRVWVKLGGGYSTLNVELDGQPARLALGDSRNDNGITRSAIIRGIRARRATVKPSRTERKLRRLARTTEVRTRYRDAWLLIDRDKQADDNAEHLYRHILENHPDINAFFVLNESSHDWPRLRRDGFRLIAFGSPDHHLLLLNARHVVSSHADSFVLHVLPDKSFGDMLNFKFTFLQHGVIRDDISRWLNGKRIDLFVTSSPQEHESIAGDVGRYKFGRAQTRMVGLARHDALLARTQRTEKVLLIMPTWRQYLVSKANHATSVRRTSDEFYDSHYARAWKGLLHSAQLRELTELHGYKVVFFPHSNMQIYADWFEAPAWVDVRTHKSDPVLQLLYRRAAVMVTDYSSVFFEMGLIDKPVIYYQFDQQEMYSGAHPSLLGYFDFERDGFGPVTETESGVIAELAQILERGCVPSKEYLRRMRDTLPLRDGENRERTVQAIKALDSRELVDDQSEEIALEQANIASKRGILRLAENRWDAQLAASATPSEHTLLACAQAKRRVNRLGQAEALLDRVVASDEQTKLLLRVERARLDAAKGELEGALQAWLELSDEDLALAALAPQDPVVAVVRLQRRLGRLDDAQRTLDRLPDSPVRTLEWAELAMERGDYREAGAHFDQLVKSDADELCLRKAEVYVRLGDVAEARTVVERYIDAGGSAPEAEMMIAEIAELGGEHDEASDRIRALESGMAGWSEGSVLALSRLCSRLGMLEQAEQVLSQAATGCTPPAVHAARLEIYEAGGRWRAILDMDRSWLKYASRQVRLRCALMEVRAFTQLGQSEAALALVGKLRAAEPGSSDVLRAQAETLQAAGRWDEAAEHWQRHLATFPDVDAQLVRARLGLALEQLGRRDESSAVLASSARANALQRLQADPDDQAAYAQLLRLMTLHDRS